MSADGGEPVGIGLGSNVGDRIAALEEALSRLASLDGLDLVAVSSVWDTSPVGGPPQDDFRNAAALFRSSLGPREILGALLETERALGRVRDGVRDGPRRIDCDLLFHGDSVVSDGPGSSDAPGSPGDGLLLPHPRMAERRFVLEPLAEVAPTWRHPVLERTVLELRDRLAGVDQGRVQPVGELRVGELGAGSSS